MGLPALKRLFSMQRERKRKQSRRQIQARNGPIAKRKSSPCQQDDNSENGKRMTYSGPFFPEDIWCHIHSLMPMRDAARAACVSHAFKRSWRCRPTLTFSRKTLGMKESACGKNETTRDFTSKVGHILKKHSGMGLKKLKLDLYDYNAKACCYLDSWLQTAVTPGIEELTVKLSSKQKKYNFPCSLLSDGSGNSIRCLRLSWCAFSPSVGLGLRSLTRLYLCDVRITGDEFGCLLYNSFALERLKLKRCNKIICLRIPCLLQQLSYLEVFECDTLQVIESEAPNLSNFQFAGHKVQLSLGEALQLKILIMDFPGAVCYVRAELPSSLPNLETLTIHSHSEMVDTPLAPSKFLHLKYLSIDLSPMAFPPAYDYCSLISFFDASPSLETFILNVLQLSKEHGSIFGDPSRLRQMPGHHHDNLKSAKIIGFCSAKSLVELTCHIIENTTSLECLTLDTTNDFIRNGHCFASCSLSKFDNYLPLHRDIIVEAHRGLLAIRTYIEGKVPSKIKLNVVEPCSRCHFP